MAAVNCSRFFALIDNADVVERILGHLNLWGPPAETFYCVRPDPLWPRGEIIPLSYHPVPAHLNSAAQLPCGAAMPGSPASSSATRQGGPLGRKLRRDDLGSAGHSLLRPTHQDSAPDFHYSALAVRMEFPILQPVNGT